MTQLLTRALRRRALAASAALASALLLVTCTGEPVAPGAPRVGQLAIAPIWPAASRLGGLVLDNVRLTVVRLPSDTVARVSRTFSPTTTQLTLSVPILLQGTSENLEATLELFSGTTLLFSGTQLVTVGVGGSSSPVSLPVTFAGPGGQVASLALQPRDTTIAAGSTLPFTVTAQDSQQVPVALFYTTWSSSDPNVTIDGAGVATAGSARGTVTITAVTPSGARDSTTLTVAPAATQLLKVSGDNQIGVASTALAQPLVVEVRAADNLPVPGVTVTFAALAGGGSVDSATATTDAQGQATTGAILGATVGAQSFTASASGTNTVTFAATATANTGPITWTGAVGTDWSTAGNWSPATVPTSSDNVSIVPATNQPTLSANAVANSVTIAGAGAQLTIAGHSLTITQNLTVHTDGLLVMTNPSDLVIVGGDAAFSGGDETGFLSAGELRLSGNFNQQQQTSTRSFFATGTHRTVMNDTLLQSVTFCCTPGTSGFRNLDISNSVGINIQFSGNGVSVSDTLISQVGAGPAPLLYTLGSTLTAARLRVDKLIVDRGTLVLDEGGVAANQQFDNVTFQNYLTTFTQFRVIAPGAPTGSRTLTFNNLTFQPLVTGNTGRYLNVTAPTGTLIVDLPGASLPNSNGPAFTTTSGVVTVNWPAIGPIQWTGATSNDFLNPGNWNPATIPTATDDVIIPVTPTQPTVLAGATVNSMTVAAGATVSIANGQQLTLNGNLSLSGTVSCPVANCNLTVAGNVVTLAGSTLAPSVLDVAGVLSVAGTYAVSNNTLFSGTGQQIPAALPYTNLTVTGTAALTGRTTVSSSVNVGGTGNLTLGGNTLVVGLMQVGNGAGDVAVVTMTDPLDSIIAVNSTWQGGSTVGRLTAGVLTVSGNFFASSLNSPSSFAPSGTFKTVFNNATQKTVTFSAGATGSHFQELDVSASTGGLLLPNDLTVLGELTSLPSGAAPVLDGNPTKRLLTVGGLRVSGLTLDNIEVVTSGTLPITQFDNVTIQNVTTGTALAINDPGRATPYVFNNISFTAVPSLYYLLANDLAPADGVVLTVDMVNATPATPGSLFFQGGGAIINWPATSPIKTWTGAQTSDWQTTTNWSPAGIPAATDDVIIPAVATQPVMSAPVSIRNLTVQTGALLNLNSFALNVSGSVSAPSATSFIGGGGTLTLTGTGNSIGGNLSTALPVAVTGNYTLAGRTVIGNLTISGSGNLAAGGQTLVVGAALNTTGSGTLTMTNALDSVLVTGAGIFGGGNTSGLLTAGYLKVGGSFTQTAATSITSFAASGTHRTELGAAAVRIVNFASPALASSHFNDLIVTTATGGLSLAANTFVNGQLISQPTGGTPLIGVTAGAKVLTVAGVDVSRLAIDQNVMTIGGGLITQFDTVSFTGQANGVAQLTIDNPGTASPITFTALAFGTTPINGVYIAANDLDGAAPNALTINIASASPAAPSATLFTATNGAVLNWPAVSPIFTWTGTTSSDWFTGTNWSTGTVPTATDNVVVPAATPNSPVINNTMTVNDLTVQAGASVTSVDNGNTINGVFTFAGTWTGCCSDAITLNGNASLSGTFVDVAMLVQAGSVTTLTGNTTMTTSTLQINGELIVNGHTLDVGQSISLGTGTGTGLLTMTNPADLVITTTADFQGADETGHLTAGTLQVQNLSQGINFPGDPAAFFASGTHRTILAGPSSSSLNFANPTTSRFQELDLSGVSAVLNLNSDVTVAGQVIAQTGTSNGPSVSGTLVTLSAGGANIGASPGFTALTFNGVPLVLTGGTITSVSNVTFDNQNPNGAALTVNDVGAGAAFTFDNLSFTTILSAGGFHLVANDLDGALPFALTIDVTNANPATGALGTTFNTINGAVINWPPTGGTITWTGGAGSDWSNPANWSGGVVPGVVDNVVIAFVTTSPVLSASVSVNNLTVVPSATIDLGTFALGVNGTLDNGGSIFTASSGILVLSGTGGQLLRGTVNADVSVTPGASYLLNGRLTITAPHFLLLAGILDLGGNTADVGLLTVTTTTGQLRMLSSADSMIVADVASFDGASTNGVLTAGVLLVGGDFVQLNTQSTESFVASGAHKTVFNGAAGPQSILFLSPGTGLQSRFQNIEIATGGGNATSLGSNANAVDVTVTSGGGLTLGGNTLTLSGNFATSGAGTLTMTNSADFLAVGGSANFAGGDATGRITAGVVQVGGNFTQGGTATAPAFIGGGTNLVRLIGGTTALSAVGSNLTTVFHALDIATTGPVTLTNTTSLNLDGTGALQILTPVSVTFVGGANALAFDGPTTTVAGSTLTGTKVWLTPGSSILGGFNVVTTGWRQVTAPQLQVPFNLPYQNLEIFGTNVFLDAGAQSIPGNFTSKLLNAGFLRMRDTLGARTLLTVAGTTQVFGTLRLDGGKLTTGALDVATLGGSRGFLSMLLPSDSVIVLGDALFNGGSTNGTLTAGVLQIGGNFSQTTGSSALAFAPSGTHLTKLGASGARTVSFANPGAGAAGSHFKNLDMTAASGGLTLTSAAIVDSAFIVGVGAGAPKLFGGGNTLTSRQWQVLGMVVDNAPMILNEQGTGLAQTFNSVTFQGFPTTATTVSLMDVTAAGSALANRPITFNGLTVQTSLGSGGLYAKLVSSNALGVTLNINGSNDPTGGPSRSNPPFGTTVAGARILWQ